MDVPLYLFRLYLPFDAVVLSSELSLSVCIGPLDTSYNIKRRPFCGIRGG